MDENFLKRLIETFKIEAEEHYNNLANGLITLEKVEPGESCFELVETLHREAHSLKGAARAVSFTDIEDVCKSLESLFSAVKRDALALSKNVFALAFMGVDLIKEMIYLNPVEIEDDTKLLSDTFSLKVWELLNLSKNETSPPPEKTFTTDDDAAVDGNNIPAYLELNGNSDFTSAQSIPNKEQITTHSPKDIQLQENIRISVQKLDSLYLQAEELLASKLAMEQFSKDLQELSASINRIKLELNKSQSALRRNKYLVERQNEFTDSFSRFSEVIISIDNRLKVLTKSSVENTRKTGIAVTELMDSVKDIIMFKFSHLLDLFPKAVRDLSSELGKDVDFVMSGTDIQIDRRILEGMKDPLIHIIRNAIDHGFESSEERVSNGKSPKGNLSICIKHAENRKVEIKISDDGKGIDIEKLKHSAVKKGLISLERSNELSEDDAIQLLFVSGTTTKKIITDISGYGLGMAIVKEKVDKLNGTINIKTKPLLGTEITITLPITLTMLRGLVVQCSDRQFVIPSNYINNVNRVSASNIKRVENKSTIILNDIPVTLLYLCDILGIKKYKTTEDSSFVKIVVITFFDKLVAFAVSDILEEIELLIKPLNKQLARIKNISGATILGNGKIVPVLNIPDLIKTTEKSFGKTTDLTFKTNESARDILVVDDSITSRMLLQDILETAGYNVKSTSDGMNALKIIKESHFDLIVSDIEMPLMNGFQFTRLVKSMDNLKDIPVVLVTALSRDEDKIKGMDAGANAYIVKSDFEQSNLLEVISRLLQ